MCGAGGCPGCFVGTPPSTSRAANPLMPARCCYRERPRAVPRHRCPHAQLRAREQHTQSTLMTTSCWVQEHGLPARRRRGTVSFAPCLHDLQGDVQGRASDLHSVRFWWVRRLLRRAHSTKTRRCQFKIAENTNSWQTTSGVSTGSSG